MLGEDLWLTSGSGMFTFEVEVLKDPSSSMKTSMSDIDLLQCPLGADSSTDKYLELWSPELKYLGPAIKRKQPSMIGQTWACIDFNQNPIPQKYFWPQFPLRWNLSVPIGWKWSHDFKQPIRTLKFLIWGLRKEWTLDTGGWSVRLLF